MGIRGERAGWQDRLWSTYLKLVEESGLDRAVLLAFDAVYDAEGRMDELNTHLYLRNEYVAEFCQQNPRILFGASIHPYRKDAVQELEKCVAAGAVLVKWLPLTQMMDPADAKCIPLYEAMAHHHIPLLCHTGGEKTLHAPDKSVRDPAKLVEALKRGVTVIAAHCGTHSIWGETDYFPTWFRMASSSGVLMLPFSL
jgi:predicted TIM-barrel fold metal-dependent hydrolase